MQDLSLGIVVTVSYNPEVCLSQAYQDSLRELDPAGQQRCADSLVFFLRDPGHPGLRFGRLQGTSSQRLYKIRAADDIRIIMAKEGDVFVLLLAGSREDIYERARRARFVIDLAGEMLRFVEPQVRLADEASGATTLAGEGRRTVPTARSAVLNHWTDTELVEAGFDTVEIVTIRSLESFDAALDLFDADWDEETIDLIFELAEITPEEWRTLDLFGDRGELRLRQAIAEFGSLHGISRLFSPEEVEKIATQPIEDWMIFLPPDQRAATTSRYDGPARVRGSAGTGKTVVGLHWAAERARRSCEEAEQLPILFTTYVKTLPPVFANLYDRMPDSVPDAVEFVNVDKLASRICREDGARPQTIPPQIGEASRKAFDAVVRVGTPLADDGISRSYLEEEVRNVIKGRGLRKIEDYFGIRRTGRGTRFDKARRRQAWAYMVAWDKEMKTLGTVDFPDIIVLAVEHASRRDQATYRSAVIDEAQDLTLMGLRLIRTLVNGPTGVDRPDGLLIVGDGAQRVYPGAFTLRQAGVEVRGRTTLLRRNYRNTAQILGAAMAVAGREPVVGMDDDEFQRLEEVGEVNREGLRPLLVDCGDDERETQFVVDRINGIVSSGMAGLGDIGIFVPFNATVRSTIKKLGAHDIAATTLDNYEGVTTPEVKVGTYFRAKGLEFKVVFLPKAKRGVIPREQRTNQDDDEYRDQRELALTQFFVAMTRARDHLIVSFGGDPSPAVLQAIDEFEVLDPDDL